MAQAFSELHEGDQWQTSDTFLNDIHSGDPERLKNAFKRFVEGRLAAILAQIRRALPDSQQSVVEDVAQEVLVELLTDILEKGWRHPPGVRFRQCVGQLAKDAIATTKRKSKRRKEVEMTAAILEPTCCDLVGGFMRAEVVAAAEARVRAVTSAVHWQIFEKWREREGMAVPDPHKNLELLAMESAPLTDSERKVLQRIRQAIGTELEAIARRGGFDVRELFDGGS